VKSPDSSRKTTFTADSTSPLPNKRRPTRFTRDSVPRLPTGEHRDPTLARFGLRVSPKGKRTYQVLFRYNQKTRRLKIGSEPAWTLDKAREKAMELLREVDSGRDPSTTWRRHAKAIAPADGPLTFGKLTEQFFEDCERRVKGGTLRPTTLSEWRRLYAHELQPITDRPAAEITRAEIKDLLRPIVERAAVVSNRTQALIARVYSWAVEEDKVVASPVAGMKRRHNEGDGRDRVLSPDEIKLVWHAAGDLGGAFGDVVRLALLTGLRLRNLLHAKVEEIDLKAKVWTLPEEKMKAARIHVVPLSDMALEIVRPRISGATTPFLFPSPKKRDGVKPIDSQGHAAARIRAGADEIAKKKLERWTIHDLKRTVGTGMREYLKPAVDRAVVSLILAHAPEGAAATSRYDRAPMMDERREALTRWAQWIKVTASSLRRVGPRA
jgi:integrase